MITRTHLVSAIESLGQLSLAKFTEVLDEVGVPTVDRPVGEVPIKRHELAARCARIDDPEVGVLATRFIKVVRRKYPAMFLDIAFGLEEALWMDDPAAIKIPRRVRNELVRHLDAHDVRVFERDDGLLDVLERLGFLAPTHTVAGEWFGLRPKIVQHMFRNADWQWELFFTDLKHEDLSDRRFALLLEALMNPRVRPDTESQSKAVGIANKLLGKYGIELRHSGEDGGYALYALVRKGGALAGKPKYVIFASQNKPDIVLQDAITMDIRILKHEDKVLVYDRPIGVDGLGWKDLLDWWCESSRTGDRRTAAQSLYSRLAKSLPNRSPGQRRLFREYHAMHRDALELVPALLPEVWLHYDQRTVEERGFDVLTRQRMDFLLLLKGGARVVIEVDGAQHYADANMRAEPERYARMVAADRDLKLSGYEVFRFGADELKSGPGPDGEERARRLVRAFFERLFKQYGVRVIA